jgi:hypothetical protein
MRSRGFGDGDDPLLAQFFMWVLGLVWVPLIWEADSWGLHVLGWVALTWFWWPSWVQVARRALRQTASPPTPTSEDGAAAISKRFAESEVEGAPVWPVPAMRTEAGDDAAAERAARVATNKAARAAAKAASSAAYLKTHEPRSKSPGAGRG